MPPSARSSFPLAVVLALLGACSSPGGEPVPDVPDLDDGALDADSGVAEVDGDDADGDGADTANRPPLARFIDAPPSCLLDLPVAESVHLGLEATDPDGDTLSVSWVVRSAVQPAVDCHDVLVVASEERARTLRFPSDAPVVACADEVDVTATVSDGQLSAQAALRIRVAASATLGVVWQEDPRNPVLPLGGCPTWDCLGHSDPTLGRLPDGSLALWIAAGGDRGGPVVGRAVEQNGSFAFAPDAPVVESPVVGATPPVDANEPWDYFRETPSIRFDPAANAWALVYLAYTKSYFDDAGIGLVRSRDAEGTDWPQSGTRLRAATAGNWDEHFLTSPSLVVGSDGVWRLYYVGASFARDEGRGKVGLLTSIDGTTWEPHPEPVFEPRPGAWDDNLMDVAVAFVEGRYLLWYTGYDGPVMEVAHAIGLAASEDGLSWTRVQDEPVLSAGAAGRWNDWTVLDPEILLEADGSLTLVAYGKSHTPPYPELPEHKPGRIGLWRSVRE